MGELVFVGLGLGDKGVSLAGIDAIKRADVAYLETYTSPPSPKLAPNLEAATGKKIEPIDREALENGEKILKQASTSSVALAVQGDPMIATTHIDLRGRAISRGIATRIVHGAAISSAAASESGLHVYKFGGPFTFTRESKNSHQEAYQSVHRNLLGGQHTLFLLEYDVEKSSGAEPAFVFERLLAAEKNFKLGVLGDGTFALILSRVGMEDQALWGGSLEDGRRGKFGRPPHAVIIPGPLHFTEAEALSSLLRIEVSRVPDNAAGVKRTAQVLVPKYVAKAKKALGQARLALKDKHEDLLENAELYLRDSENFLANNQDELAMLGVGYAEGLIDALNFQGEVNLDW